MDPPGHPRGLPLGAGLGFTVKGLVKKVAKSVEVLRGKRCDFGGRGPLVCSYNNGMLKIWTLGGKWLAG